MEATRERGGRDGPRGQGGEALSARWTVLVMRVCVCARESGLFTGAQILLIGPVTCECGTLAPCCTVA